MKQFFETIYNKYSLKRRYRRVSDGLWIFGGRWPTGIFIEEDDWQDNLDFYKDYLFDIDDELANKAGKV